MVLAIPALEHCGNFKWWFSENAAIATNKYACGAGGGHFAEGPLNCGATQGTNPPLQDPCQLRLGHLGSGVEGRFLVTVSLHCCD